MATGTTGTRSKSNKAQSSPPASPPPQPRQAYDNNAANAMKIELPPFFVGNGTEDFSVWCRRLEVALDALPVNNPIDMTKLLPSRLSGPAFNYWDNLPALVKNNYQEVKEQLTKVFRADTNKIDAFKRMMNARPRQPNESLQVYAADLRRLVREAFPDYGFVAQVGEAFRRFLAGLQPALQLKCYEHGAQTLDSALKIAQQIESANEAQHNLLTQNTNHNNMWYPQQVDVSSLSSKICDLSIEPKVDVVTVKEVTDLRAVVVELKDMVSAMQNKMDSISSEREGRRRDREHNYQYSRYHSKSPNFRSGGYSRYRDHSRGSGDRERDVTNTIEIILL
ncbi:uncharacterized protein [Antedon mediterranea]|uniref:uncharacterized protein n=1 Tax=Antedon mediterranea TaxID=105859 RepID=UPI003AF72FAE